ncbi:MAG: hypothetical protein BWY82_02700 [Verrucomicrobia bacterium ADurb.Bin474]|nr:MAG: hypothetical protein BWY82_02700 [Verrucomicrobia bacterium ADurb.Bin474]
MQILEQNQVHHIVDVGIQIDFGIGQMETLPKSGQCGAINRMPIFCQTITRGLPFPPACCRAVHDNKGELLRIISGPGVEDAQ